MIKTYVTVLSGDTRDWEGMLPLVPLGYVFHRRGVKLVVTEAHTTLGDDDELDEGGTATQFVGVTALA